MICGVNCLTCRNTTNKTSVVVGSNPVPVNNFKVLFYLLWRSNTSLPNNKKVFLRIGVCFSAHLGLTVIRSHLDCKYIFSSTESIPFSGEG